jgi:hypothetical protein
MLHTIFLRDRDVALVGVCPPFSNSAAEWRRLFLFNFKKKGLTIDYRFPLRKRHLTHPISEFISNQ